VIQVYFQDIIGEVGIVIFREVASTEVEIMAAIVKVVGLEVIKN
jgi:hypothetical protein